MLIAGPGIFGTASAAAGLAHSAEMMLIARAAAGIGAAMIMPITLAVITATFPEAQRGKVIGEVAGSTGTHAPGLIRAAQQSFVDGCQQAMWAGVAVMGALFAYITLRGIGGSTTGRSDELN